MVIKSIKQPIENYCDYAGTDYECCGRGLNCCDCGIRENGCGCAYCWTCNCCDTCYNEN